MEDTDKTRAQLIEELNKLRRQLEDQNRHLSLQAAVERVRAEAATMRQSADIGKVILAFRGGLEEVGVRNEAVCVNIVDEEAGVMYCYALPSDALVPREIIPDEVLVQENAVEGFHLLRGDIPLDLARQRGWSLPGYEIPLWVAPDTFPDDLRRLWHLDNPEWDKMVGRHGINVPFTYGGLFAQAWPGEVYSEADLELVRPFARAMDLGYARYFDFQELESANKEIQEQTERKSAFLASMSHELRTPMNAIKGFVNLVLRRRSENLTDRQRENLGKATQASDHLLAMINDLLDLSKIEAGRMDVNAGPFNVKALVASCCATISPLVAEKPDVKLEYDLPEDIGEVNTDQARVRQMVINLLSNAIKFTDSGSVTVRAGREDDQLVIAVADTGKGIPADEIDTIFDEYRQVKGSDAEHKGTGLGLSITRKFAELLGGSIRVESEVGKGSTFTVRIPMVFRES